MGQESSPKGAEEIGQTDHADIKSHTCVTPCSVQSLRPQAGAHRHIDGGRQKDAATASSSKLDCDRVANRWQFLGILTVKWLRVTVYDRTPAGG